MDSSNSCPNKSEIQQIFKRLRSIPANKVCFDCHAKNPTWSSVTYGIFICIDCSGIHRSLGVHLTFVRSTQLDSNWTWQQIRQMQLGGNGNANTFFKQHNCNTSDVQVKYKSRAAQLYRDKLHHNAAQAMRLHGTKLFIDTPQTASEDGAGSEETEKDFFEEHENDESAGGSDVVSRNAIAASAAPLPVSRNESAPISMKNGDSGDGAAPSVEAALSTSPTAAMQANAARKSTITGRKPGAAKKGVFYSAEANVNAGLGVKKGLGAQKVKKDFAEIEREAEMADQVRTRMEEEQKAPKVEDEEKIVTSMRLAYQDLSVQQKKQEDKLRNVDPRKANQVERLGMGAGGSKAAVSHSMLTGMGTIEQEEPIGMKKSGSFGRRRDPDPLEDEFEVVQVIDREDDWRRSRFDEPSRSSNWENEFEVMKSGASKKSTTNNSWSNDFDDKPREKPRSRPDTLSTSNNSAEDAQKKFGNAKAISSDMYFGGNGGSGGSDANVNRFQGSSSISSAEYFGRTETTPGARYAVQTPDMDDVKESVRQGVTKVAGRLSNMASGVMTQLQDRYGY